MRARGRHIGGRQTGGRQTGGRYTDGRHSAAAQSATADLFADGFAGVGADGRTAEALPAILEPLPAIAAEARPTVLHGVAPVPQAVPHVHPTHSHPRRCPRPGQLWHAVVFPELAASTLQRLCLSAQHFTPLVSIEMPNALLLEIKGSVKLFGSLAALHAAIEAEWSRLSLRTASATAPTALAALWFARAGQPACIEDPAQLAAGLAQLPIGCTSWDAEWLRTLHAMGVMRVGELLRLPRSGVARRLSPAAVLDLDIALARQAAPRRAFVARVRFRERCDFETEIETVVYLQKALEPLIARCAQFLRERQAGVQAFELTLRHRALPATRVRLGLAGITGDRRRLAAVLEERLNRLELAAPVRGMELKSGVLRPLSADSLDAFAGMRGGGRETAPQLVERLRARLGDEAVYGVASIAEHRPEAAWRRVQELLLTESVRADVRAGGMYMSEMPRPVWLLDEPLLLAANLQQLCQEGSIIEQGPERIESGWWDGKDVARDYYVARQARGARWWVFQQRGTQCWYLHGVFA